MMVDTVHFTQPQCLKCSFTTTCTFGYTAVDRPLQVYGSLVKLRLMQIKSFLLLLLHTTSKPAGCSHWDSAPFSQQISLTYCREEKYKRLP